MRKRVCFRYLKSKPMSAGDIENGVKIRGLFLYGIQLMTTGGENYAEGRVESP